MPAVQLGLVLHLTWHLQATISSTDALPVSVPLLNVTSAGFAASPPATCPGGTQNAPNPLMWNVLYEPYKNGTNRGNDLSQVDGVATGMLLGIYPAFWNNYTTDLSRRQFPTSVSAIWPTLTGPWCDKKADPNCSPQYIKNLGGCPQAVDLEAHKAALKTGLDWQVPVDFDGYVSYDMEGWDGGEGNTSGYAKECGGVDAYHAAAKEHLLRTMLLFFQKRIPNDIINLNILEWHDATE